MTRRLAALTISFLAGCAGAPISPYQPSTRDDGVEVAGGKLRLVCAVGTPGSAERITSAAQSAVTASGGGTVTPLTGSERAHLLDLLRAKGGAAFPADVKRYEAEVVAKIRDSLAPIKVVWTLGSQAVTLDVDGAAVKFLEDEVHPNRYRLLIEAKPGVLSVPGDRIVRQADGAGFTFKAPAFKLYLKEGNRRINLRLASEKAEFYPEERVLFLEVADFKGDPSALFNALLAADLRQGEEPGAIRFVHYDTVVLLGATLIPDAPEESESAGEAPDEDEDEGEGEGEGEPKSEGEN